MRDTNCSSISIAKSGISQCRICGSKNIRKRGDVEFYINYAWPIYDCDECGCRFTLHDGSTYELLYSEQSSCYSRYIVHAQSCKTRFDRGDRVGLRADLSQVSKYRFIIEQIDPEPAGSRILEIGCSRGHLTSVFILDGRMITGVDVSRKALAAARGAFGDHFAVAGDPLIEARAPYDVIFHVGTIGCVADPVGTTKELLDLLRPGGRLLFNAPNRDSCTWRDQLWCESAPPPDVVTLFPPGFWRDHFDDVAQIDEVVERDTPEHNFLILLRRLARQKWPKPVPMSLKDSEQPFTPSSTFGDAFWRNLERIARKTAPWTGVLRFVPSYPTEFGLFIQMVKR